MSSNTFQLFKEEIIRRARDRHLFPFYALVALFYIAPDTLVPAVFLKVLPVWSLVYFVRKKSGFQKSGVISTEGYSEFVTMGLVMSSVGDIFLVMSNIFFIPGMLAFLIAHVCNLLVFGANNMSERYTKYVYAIGGVSFFLFITDAVDSWVTKLMVLVYLSVICIVGWRAQARYEQDRTFASLLACIGYLLFMISDAVLATSKWKLHIPMNEFIVLTTYYLAQLCIASSTKSDTERAIPPRD